MYRFYEQLSNYLDIQMLCNDSEVSKVMDDTDEQNLFVVDEVSSIIKQAIEDTIGGNTYQQTRGNVWTSQVVESCLQSLAKLNKGFKYIVTSTIMQKNGAGLHSTSSCYWDNNTDGSCTVRWENKTMYCIVSVFGLAIIDEGDMQYSFVVDEINGVIKQSMEDIVNGNIYQQNKVNVWTSQVVETCLQSLAKLNKSFKYIVTSTIMQKNGAGLHSASSCYWNNTTDNSCTVRWENRTMYCIVSVFGLTV